MVNRKCSEYGCKKYKIKLKNKIFYELCNERKIVGYWAVVLFLP